MNDNKDLFDDSVMTFGEHLEVLRVHVIRALIGLTAAVVLSLFFGNVPIDIMRRPLDRALDNYGLAQANPDEEAIATFDWQKFKQGFADWWNGESDADTEPERAKIKLKDFRKQLEEGKRTPENTFAVRIGLREIRFRDHEEPKTGEAAEKGEGLFAVDLSSLTDGEVDELRALMKEQGIESSLGSDVVESTIRVRLPVEDLANALNQIDPEKFDPPAEDEDRAVEVELISLTLARLQDQVIEAGSPKPITLTVQEAFMTYVKVAIVTGLILSGPYVFYELWLFVAAGLYPHERKYVYRYLPISLGLFFAGVLLCYFGVLPLVLKFLFGFNQFMGVEPQIRLTEWINFSIVLPLMFGVSFQLPLVMLFLERISIFEIKAYEDHRRMAVLVIAIISMLLTPADPASMLMMMIPLVFLYQLGILMCKWSPEKEGAQGAAPV